MNCWACAQYPLAQTSPSLKRLYAGALEEIASLWGQRSHHYRCFQTRSGISKSAAVVSNVAAPLQHQHQHSHAGPLSSHWASTATLLPLCGRPSQTLGDRAKTKCCRGSSIITCARVSRCEVRPQRFLERFLPALYNQSKIGLSCVYYPPWRLQKKLQLHKFRCINWTNSREWVSPDSPISHVELDGLLVSGNAQKWQWQTN